MILGLSVDYFYACMYILCTVEGGGGGGNLHADAKQCGLHFADSAN